MFILSYFREWYALSRGQLLQNAAPMTLPANDIDLQGRWMQCNNRTGQPIDMRF